MNNLVFNNEGPVMDGTWYNPNNGDKFTFGTFDITGYDIVTGTLMDLNIKSVSNANMTLDINSGSTFRYGR